MRSWFRVIGPLAAAAVFAAAAYGQEAPPPPPDSMAQEGPQGPGPGGPGPGGFGPGGPGGPGFHKMELLGFGGFHGGKVVTGAPFSAVAVTQSSHALSDGTKINTTNKVTLYRDSQGRFRKEGTRAALEFLCARRPVANPNAQQVRAAEDAARTFEG